MAFTVNDFADLTRLLAAHPEWQAELWRLLLADDFLALPAIVRELAEAQKRAEQHLGKLEAAMLELTEEQRRVWESVGDLKGYRLERADAERAPAYFGQWLRRVRVIWPGALDRATEESLERSLTPAELHDVLLLDVVVSGRLRQPPALREPEVWLAVEVSAVIDRRDVERAQRRAALLRKAGRLAVPVVAGETATPGATDLLRDAPVALVLDGRTQGWEKAPAEAQQGLA